MKQITNFAINLDEATKQQFDHCCSQDFVFKGSLMPDGHSGYVAPVGSVLYTKDVVVPAWVGYDIGCGMIALKFDEGTLEQVNKKREEVFKKVQEHVPMGTGKVNHIQDVSSKTKEQFKELLNQFKEGPYRDEVLKYLKNKALSHLGSLGSGNHFLELCEHKDELWLIIHSGSRGVGHTVATYYMKASSGSETKYEATHPLNLSSQEGKEYMNVLKFGLEFAVLNRMEMAYKVREVIREVLNDQSINFELWVNKNHNHAVEEHGFLVHRKGATPANKGERGVIPANMRDGCFLVEGLGNEDFLYSSSHGAGRKYSRRAAKKNITMQAFEKSMQGITGTISEGTLDEAPEAYKNIYNVMEAQKESVRIIKHLKPIINWKGEE